MSAITMPPRTTVIGPHLDVYRMSVDEYERLVAAGALDDPRCQDSKPGQDVPVVIDGNEVGRIAVGDMLP
jgi:hypothetical protein